jgi:hypothetical protein
MPTQVVPEVTKQITNPWAVPAFIQWLNGLTLPGMFLAAIGVTKWYYKKEAQAKQTVATVLGAVETLRTNDLMHMNETLKEMKTCQERMADSADRHQEALITATNASKDAIVQAILTLKK